MTPNDVIKVCSELRDLQLVDSDGRKCGIVDDVAFEGGPGGDLTATALLVGPGAWERRLPRWLFAILARAIGRRITRVPWSAVTHVTSCVTLNAPRATFGLMQFDERLGRLLGRIPAL